MRLLLIAAGALLAACHPLSGPMDDIAVTTPTVADCAARGGSLQPVGRAQTLQCVVTYADAGKRCTTGTDCLGDCRIEAAPFPEAGADAVGRCHVNNQPFGCHARVENGKAMAAICVD